MALNSSFYRVSRLWQQRCKAPGKTKKRGPYLIQPWLAIGDTIFSLEVAERIWEHQTNVTIDLLCTEVQMQILADHPRMVKTEITDLSIPSSHQSEMQIIPIHKDFYAEQSEHMQRKRHEYADLLKKRNYATVFIEDLHNFKTLFGGHQYYAHHSLRSFETQAIVERVFPLSFPFLRDMPKYIRTRELVDGYFRAQSSLEYEKEKPVLLHLASHRIAEAERRSAQVKEHAGRPDGVLLLINADTSSSVTRPPTELLVTGIGGALGQNSNIVVGILPGYTCPEAPKQVYKELEVMYGRQIQYVEPTSWPEHLLDTTAFIDQADIFMTGDTGLMHLAVTQKMIPEKDASGIHPRNDTAIITLWGGTRPGYWGYPKLTTILGEGNPLQRRMYPGIRKYGTAPLTGDGT